MSNNAKSLVNEMLSHVGESDKRFNAYIGNASGTAWCGATVWYAVKHQGIKINPDKPALAQSWYDWGKKNERLVKKKNAQYGDIVTFDWNDNDTADHVGVIIENYGNGSFKTVEGNTGSPARVRIRIRVASDIQGIIRPEYDKPQKTTAKKSSGIVLPKRGYFQRGDSGAKVKHLQTWLNLHGYNCGSVDGELGPKVEAAVLKFQGKNGLMKDGLFGTACLKTANKI